MLRNLKFLYRKSDNGSFLKNSIKSSLNLTTGKSVLCHYNTQIVGLKNINIDYGKIFFIGLLNNGFGSPKDDSFLNIKGKLLVKDNFELGKGARFSIGKEAVVELNSGFINNNSIISIEKKLYVGKNCAIGWNVQIIDTDYHSLEYDGKQHLIDRGITIEDNVWVGSNVSIMKNVIIASGCVVAGGSLVNKKFEESNCLIGGNPAKILKKNVKWK